MFRAATRFSKWTSAGSSPSQPRQAVRSPTSFAITSYEGIGRMQRPWSSRVPSAVLDCRYRVRTCLAVIARAISGPPAMTNPPSRAPEPSDRFKSPPMRRTRSACCASEPRAGGIQHPKWGITQRMNDDKAHAPCGFGQPKVAELRGRTCSSLSFYRLRLAR
jgi:hypothetical protein